MDLGRGPQRRPQGWPDQPRWARPAPGADRLPRRDVGRRDRRVGSRASVGRTSRVRQWKCWEAVRMLRNRVVIAAVLTLAVASSAVAQTTTDTKAEKKAEKQSEKQAEKAEKADKMMAGDVQTRPATTTFMGDTGLWYVPTGEVLPAKKWSMSAYRVSFNDNQGFSNVANWTLTFADCAGGRAENFAT